MSSASTNDERSDAPLVCLVDDDPSVLRSLRRLLRALGLNSMGFVSGEELFREPQGLRANVFILDIFLPGMSGYGVARELAKKGITAPVVFVTAQRGEGDRYQEEAPSAIALLRKPFRERDLLTTLDQALGTDLAGSSSA